MRLVNELAMTVCLSLAHTLSYCSEAPRTILTAPFLSHVVTIEGNRIWAKPHGTKIYSLDQRMSIKYMGAIVDPDVYDIEFKKGNDVKELVRIEKHWMGKSRLFFQNEEIKNAPVDIESVIFAYRYREGVILRVRPSFHFWSTDFWYKDECVYLLYFDKKTTAFGNVGCKAVNGIVFVPAEASEIETEPASK